MIPKSSDMWDLMKSGMSQSAKKNIKKEIKQDKKKREESNLPAKKPTTTTGRRVIETPLDETEALLKKKVAIGELQEYQEVQEDRKRRRDDLKAKGLKPGETVQQRSVLADLFKNDPDGLEKMSPENIMKLSMLSGGGGSGGSGGNLGTLLMMMMMNQQPTGTPQTAQRPTSLLDLVKALKEIKSLTSEDDKKVKNEGNNMNQALMLFMMERMMSQKQAPVEPGVSSQLELVKYLTTLLADQNKVRDSALTDKLRQLEYQVSRYDPMEEGVKMIEYMKNFKTLFGGSMTPEGLKHELDIKKLELEETRELRRLDDDDRKMSQIGSIIEKSVDTLSETLAQPIAKGLEARIARGGKKKRRVEPTPGTESEDVDLDELEDYEHYEEDYEQPEPSVEQSEIKRRNRSRFRIVDSEEGIS